MSVTKVQYVEGPAWAPRRLDVNAGRFPLAVENHLLQMTARLVPGITTVTTNARYYSLHGYLALRARERELDWPATQQFVRRCEAVMAAVTLLDENRDDLLGAHGADKIEPHLADGALDLAVIAEPGGYVSNRSGFLPVYVGSEIELQILASPQMEAGKRLDRDAVLPAFDGMEDLAHADRLSADEARSAGHLSARAIRDSSDGPWLAAQFCSRGVSDVRPADVTRRNTIRLLARSLELVESTTPQHSFRSCLGYGAYVRSDPVLSTIPEAAAWRGTLLRHHSVNAWRRMWAWLVDRIGGGFSDPGGLTPPQVLVEEAIAACPAVTVEAFLDSLPRSIDDRDDPVNAETEIDSMGWNDFRASLAVLAVGSQRTEFLVGDARAAFLGRRASVLDPKWVHSQFERSLPRPMSDFVAELVSEVLRRAERVAARKARLQRDGTYRIPSRVHEHAGKLWKTSNEGRGSVGLRIDELGRNLVAVGVLERQGTGWGLTDLGQQLLADDG